MDPENPLASGMESSLGPPPGGMSGPPPTGMPPGLMLGMPPAMVQPPGMEQVSMMLRVMSAMLGIAPENETAEPPMPVGLPPQVGGM